MPATQVWDMASDNGEVYRIFVSAPEKGEPPKGGYPVLYVLDGDPESARMLAERLEALSGWGLRLRLQRYPNEGHARVPAQAANGTLRFAFTLRWRPGGWAGRRWPSWPSRCGHRWNR
jgi:predicted alpha/beta superfamily hydrolase